MLLCVIYESGLKEQILRILITRKKVCFFLYLYELIGVH